MITSILNVQENFYKLFQNIEIAGNIVLVRYARKSSKDYTEEQDQQVYPCISIQDYTPKPDDRWFTDLKYYQGASDISGDYAEFVRKPMWMDFRFDVSIASKSYFEYQKLQNYFIQHFLSDQKFIFNKKDLTEYNEGVVGDVVPYSVTPTDIPRSDGIFETNYQFDLVVWICIEKTKDVELVKRIIVNTINNG